MTEHPAIYSQDSAEPSEFPPTSYEQPTAHAELKIFLSPVSLSPLQPWRSFLKRAFAIFRS
jgi:hypothetical protein